MGTAIAGGVLVSEDATPLTADLTLYNTGSTTGVKVDAKAPTISISSTAGNPTNSPTIPITITFSESVTGFSVGDISVTNGSAGSFSGSGTTYTASITPSGQGTVTVNIAGSVAQDAAGNNNSAATALTRVYDNVAPTVIISSGATNPTNTSPIPVTITFLESVSDFVAGDITVGNGTKGALSGSGTSYTINITPSGEGAVTIDVAAGVAHDAVGNANTAAAQLSRTYDSQAPSVSLTSTAGNPTNSSPIPVTITFLESVSDFVAGDITVGNGTKGALSGSGTTYTINITPSGEGEVTIDVAVGVAHDAAGNASTAAAQLSRTYDSQAPSVSLTSTAGNPTNSSPIPVAITFLESVSDFVTGDITVGNGTKGALSGSGTSYTINITPSGEGEVTIDVAAGVAHDAAGNANTAAAQLSRTYDSQAPSVSLTSTAGNPTNSSPIPVTITFLESVSDFVAGDITVGNGTKGALSGSGTSYTINITPSGEGAVTIDVAAGVAHDAAGNANTAAAQLSRTYDSQGPIVSLSSTAGNSTNSSPIPVTITFTEPVSDFVAGDITVSNGTKGGLSGSGTSYTIDITPSGQGSITIDVAVGVVHDAIGNANSSATQLSRIYDTQTPTVSLSSIATEPTNSSPIPVIISFSESVSGFDVSDITVTNGSKGCHVVPFLLTL